MGFIYTAATPPPKGTRGTADSRTNRVGGGGADFGKVLGTLLNALGFQIGGDRFQDCQQLGSVSGTVQEGGCQVAGHGRIAG